eukprot:364954-Chlamydomonas_euryale.AAC.6
MCGPCESHSGRHRQAMRMAAWSAIAVYGLTSLVNRQGVDLACEQCSACKEKVGHHGGRQLDPVQLVQVRARAISQVTGGPAEPHLFQRLHAIKPSEFSCATAHLSSSRAAPMCNERPAAHACTTPVIHKRHRSCAHAAAYV